LIVTGRAKNQKMPTAQRAIAMPVTILRFCFFVSLNLKGFLRAMGILYTIRTAKSTTN
jgi:hypothetical protein